MAVTIQKIAVELGRTAPVADTPEALQWASWIARAERAITTRAEARGVEMDTLDPDVVDDVITYAVVRRITRPIDGAESTTDQLGTDVGSWQQTRRYSAGAGDIFFLDAWWDLLGLGGSAGVFSIQMTGAPDVGYGYGPGHPQYTRIWP
ncbi:MAG: hypothetical protein Q4F65_05670 [Propionibacteriaceae bacterium]|nr:hypothetical protein [Propionibacteriaceae bacterium]